MLKTIWVFDGLTYTHWSFDPPGNYLLAWKRNIALIESPSFTLKKMWVVEIGNNDITVQKWRSMWNIIPPVQRETSNQDMD